MDGWLSSGEAAARLGVTRQTLYRLISNGELVAYRIGRAVRVRDGDLEAFIEQSRITPGTRGAGVRRRVVVDQELRSGGAREP